MVTVELMERVLKDVVSPIDLNLSSLLMQLTTNYDFEQIVR